MARSDERGVALVMALLMVLAVSIITSSLLAVARTEAFSSLSYTSMSQVRYGAESGIHAAANHLLYGYAPPTAASATDPIANYDMTVSPVTYNGTAVMLSSDPDPAFASNYPSPAARAAFIAASQGALNVNTTSVGYTARATLMSMRVLTDYYTQQPVTLQTWEIVGVGRVTGSGASQVEVSSILERQAVPVFSYAAFATYNGCNALSFAGGATTKSYDSGVPLVGGVPVISQSDGNVGTNGNLDGNGGTTTLYGTLSTPRGGVGNCTTNNVTASTISGWGTVEDGLVTLPQPINPPTPPPISPPPPTTNVMFNAGGCPTGSSFCSGGGGNYTITPTTSSTIVSMGNVSLNGSTTVHLNAGIYEINSLTLTGAAHIIIDSGPVIIKVAGQGQTTPIALSGGGVSNPSLDPTQLQFVYGGTGNVSVTGGSQTAALVYVPNATTSLGGSSVDFYGSILTGKVAATGGFNIFYDRRLQNSALTAGNPTMTSFNWRTF